jgi:hypothetical protein
VVGARARRPALRAQVYDTLIARGVAPHISQYNTLMEQYALRFQLGNVVSLLTNMVAGGVQPNANTFRCVSGALCAACACLGCRGAPAAVLTAAARLHIHHTTTGSCCWRASARTRRSSRLSSTRS